MKRYNISVPKKYEKNGEEKTQWNSVGSLTHFDATADKVGLLGGDLPERVAAFYVRGSAILEDFDAISAPEFVTWTLEEQRQYYTATADLLEETVALGKEAVERLRTFSRA